MTRNLHYSRLIVVRVSHDDPMTAKAIAEVMTDELQGVMSEWVKRLPDPKPTIEVMTISDQDFPFREVHSC